jgi:two-component system phosphate regulon sensor histidine kinase PhoR
VIRRIPSLFGSDRASVGRSLFVAALCFAAGVIVVGVAAGASVLSIGDANAEVTDRLDPLDHMHAELLQALTNGEAGIRGFALTGDDEFLTPLDDARDRYPGLVAATFELVGSDPELRGQLEREVTAAEAWLTGYTADAEEAVRSGITPEEYVEERRHGKALFDTLRAEHAATSELIHARRDDALDRARATEIIGAVVTGASVVVVLLGGALIAQRTRRRIATPLAAVADGIAKLEAGELSTRVAEDGPREVRSVAAATNAFARFLEQASAVQHSRTHSDKLVRQLSATMFEHANVSALLSTTVDALGPVFGCDQVLLIDVERDRPGRILAEWVGEDTAPLGIGTQLDFPESFIALVQTEMFVAGTCTVEDIDADERVPADSNDFLRGHHVQALLVAPVLVAGEARAVISLHSATPRAWTDVDRWMARELATELGSAMRLGDEFEHTRAMVHELQQVDAAKSDFLAAVSHELRTPLTSILGYTELLLDGDAGELAPRQLDMMTIVDRNARRLLLLIDDLLTMSRIDADRLTITPAVAPVARLVDGVSEAIRPLAGAAGVTLRAGVGEPGLTAWADERALERVLLNVMSNAVKFTPPGGTITLEAAPADGGVEFRVTDTGVGIPEDEQEQLFTRFFRSSTSRELAIQGTGLGLAIVHHIVEAHAGRTSVVSRPGHGTSVTLWLPGGNHGEELAACRES